MRQTNNDQQIKEILYPKANQKPKKILCQVIIDKLN